MNRRRSRALVQLFARLAKDERGGEVLEYALTLGFLALACYVVINVVGLKFYDFWVRMDRALQQLA